ncbi:hypothetical protein ILUMI_26187 [Ignelater luminosus]|uniref:RING-type domain-containing protein n=1 Tax=Ignelater luminosus TaxID=2038154 RepID=A0A8K0C4L5_IGNLU|nr:hypothetical protein ILUMI_26187 [Ignelater luminosus]
MNSWHYTNYIQELFPNKSIETIKDVIEIVLRQTPLDNEEYQLENVINLLTETTDDVQISSEKHNSGRISANSSNEENLLDEAAGHSRTINEQELSMYFDQLLMLFPDACPSYVRDLCNKRRKTFINLDSLIDEITSINYPKRKIDARSVFTQLKEMLPNADPSYLRKQAEALAYQSENELKQFVENAIENSDYPTMENYLKNQKEMEEINQYIANFNIKDFLKKIPDPEKLFSDPNRKHALTPSDSIDEETYKEDEIYAVNFLYNLYSYLRKRDIDRVFRMNGKNLVKICSKLDGMRKAKRTPRKSHLSETVSKNISLLQEIAYLKHKKAIRRILKEYDINYRHAKAEAERNGLLQTCACCYDEELIPEECYFCKNGCIFCKDCVKAGAEAVIGEGKLDFLCLADCGSEFSIPTLQMVLDSVVFSRMAQRKQMEEIKRANLDGLETCPFCDFATIPSPDDKIFHCLNSDCMKESCRECRHISHIPLRCNEIEYDEDVKMRTYIENKMTEALLRKCWKCSKVFIKESGCNKMTCSCGANMCYVCGQAVTDYRHFGDENGDRCPLYTKDLNRFHATAVIQGATAAKAELGVDKNPNILKNDPAEGLEQHYAV